LASSKGFCRSYAAGYAIEDADWESKNGHYRVHVPKEGGYEENLAPDSN